MIMETIKYHPDEILKSNPCKINRGKLIVIGASTGGVDALSYIFSRLPEQLPPIAVVQHIPQSFGSSFIKRLDGISQLTIYEVASRVTMKNNCVYIAGGDKHMVVDFALGAYCAYPLNEEKRISRHKPSVGMGDDGCIGLKDLYENGAHTIAEKEEDCVVFGMPKKAIEMGAVSEILSLDMIISRIISYAKAPIKTKNSTTESE